MHAGAALAGLDAEHAVGASVRRARQRAEKDEVGVDVHAAPSSQHEQAKQIGLVIRVVR